MEDIGPDALRTGWSNRWPCLQTRILGHAAAPPVPGAGPIKDKPTRAGSRRTGPTMPQGYRVVMEGPDGEPQQVECLNPECDWDLYSHGPDTDDHRTFIAYWREHARTECPLDETL